MNIIIVGGGKVGRTLAMQLSRENHEITLIDTDSKHVDASIAAADIQGLVGNGTSRSIQLAAGVKHTDLLIAVTNSDESNMLSCLMAKKTGNCQAIARVRDPQYYKDISFIKEELGLSMAINPEIESALNIGRLIQIPSAIDVDSFAKGRINLISVEIPKGSCLDGIAIKDIEGKLRLKLLICTVETRGDVLIPNGDTVLHYGDKIAFIMPLHQVRKALEKINLQVKSVKSVMLAGGGNISYYLAKALIQAKMKVKILEVSKERCEELSALLPEARIINGDASDKHLLLEEGIESVDAFVALTGIDEENIMLSLFANKRSKAKVVTKISKISFDEVLRELPVGTIVYPQQITAQLIASYIRAMQNSMGSNVETLYRLMDGRVEALEFKVSEASVKDGLTGVPLMELNLKPNLLVCAIVRGKKIITPGGKDTFEVGDNVIVVTTNVGLSDLRDILG